MNELTVKQAVRPVWLLAALLMMLDALTTYLAFAWPTGAYGVAEANPLMVAGFAAFGVAGTMILKALVGILSVWVLAVRTDRGRFFRPRIFKNVSNDRIRQVAMYTLVVSVLIMGLVVGNNIRAILMIAAGA